jgi:cytosine deaminase
VLAESGIAIMSHGPGAATMPPLPLLRAHGVEVFGGSDNIRDAWSPFGNGDMLERAMLIGYRANFRHDDELLLPYRMVTEAAARVLGLTDYGIKVSGPADFVAVEAGSIAEAVATRPPRKWVMKAGRVVARDGVLTAP